MPALRLSRRRIVQTICRLAGAVAGLAIAALTASAQQTEQLSLPNVNVTAPALPVEPPYLRDPAKAYRRNPYSGRYRVEEEKFREVPCAATRIAFPTGGKCLQGYKLLPGAADQNYQPERWQ
jgi:hypothetical protein